MNNLDFVKTDFIDLSCRTGVTFDVDMRVIEECTSDPVDLSGYTAVLKIVDEDENIIIGLTGVTGISGSTGTTSGTGEIGRITGIIGDPTKGIINFNIPATVTENFTVGIFYHQIEAMISTNVYRLANGIFEVLQ